jgi:hypothetical protein
MTQLQARPTIYKGIQMRSRLEAQVAADFDRLGVAWEYEPMCFASPAGQYLPDFVLHWRDHDTYLEVKPPQSDDELRRIAARMEIVWESDPSPRLEILCADGVHVEGGRFRRSSGRIWRKRDAAGKIEWSWLIGLHFPEEEHAITLPDGSELLAEVR